MTRDKTTFTTVNGKTMSCDCDPDVWELEEGESINPPCDRYEDSFGRCNLCGHALLCHIAVTLSNFSPPVDVDAIIKKIRDHFE